METSLVIMGLRSQTFLVLVASFSQNLRSKSSPCVSIPSYFCLALVKNRQTKTAKHLSVKHFCGNLLGFDAAWLTPSKEKASKIANKNKRETIRSEFLNPLAAMSFRASPN